MKVAITHDWLVSYGGAEKVLEALIEIFPDADVFTSVYDRNKLPSNFLNNTKIYTSFLQNFPFPSKFYRYYVILMPMAFRSFNFDKYDLIISNSHACAKDINVPKKSVHICYCLTPMRYIWDMYDDYLKMENINFLARLVAPIARSYLRKRDIISSKTVDQFFVISNFISQRVKNYYNRESIVVYPPVEICKFFISQKKEDYFIAISRLVPQKRTEIIVEAFNRLQKPLKIIGRGRQEEYLKKIAKENIEFLGFLDEHKKTEILSKAKALIFASVEDFGIVPVEAMACGVPVIAYKKGGVLDTIIPNITGLFFDEQTADSVVDAVLKFEKMEFDSKKIRKHAEKFDKENFKRKILELINSFMEKSK